jgi:hypothetical protein
MARTMTPTHCRDCGIPLAPKRPGKTPEGHGRHEGRGLCRVCHYADAKKTGKIVPKPPKPRGPSPDAVRDLARRGMSDRQIADQLGFTPRTILRARKAHGIPSGVPASTPDLRAARDALMVEQARKRRSVQRSHPLAALFAGVGITALEGAACAGAGSPGSTIPDPCSGDPRERDDARRTLCSRCPVRETCLTVGRREHSPFVYGGIDKGDSGTFDRREQQPDTVVDEVVASFADDLRALEQVPA